MSMKSIGWELFWAASYRMVVLREVLALTRAVAHPRPLEEGWGVFMFYNIGLLGGVTESG